MSIVSEIFMKNDWVLIGDIAGNKAKSHGSYATKELRGNLPCRWFTYPTTLILGASPNSKVIDRCIDCKAENTECEDYNIAAKEKRACFPLKEINDNNKRGYAEFQFKVSKKKIKKARAAKIEIYKRRDDARLHSQIGGYANISINGDLLSDITIADANKEKNEYHSKDNPYGERDIGLEQLQTDIDTETIKIEVSEKTYWDIDGVKLWIKIEKLHIERLIGVISIILTISFQIITNSF